MIDRPGIYPDLPENLYHADPVVEPSLSCSIATLLLSRSPAHAMVAHPRLSRFWQEKHSDTFDFGKAAHELLLGGEGRFLVVGAEDWRGKEAKADKARAYEQGLIPLLETQWERLRVLVDVVRAQLEEIPDLREALHPDNPRESTVVWREPSGAWCRARTDLMFRRRVIDLKFTTTGATPEEWAGRTAYNFQYDFRAGWYQRGLKAVTGEDWRYQFVVVEREPPFALSFFEPAPIDYEGVQEPIARAIDLWTRCMRDKVWPGYSQELQWLERPAWAAYRWEARNARAAVDTRRTIEAAAGLPEGFIEHFGA